MTTKPTEYPEWASTAVSPDVVSPDAGRRLTGWKKVAGVPEKPPYQFFNWYQKLVYEWINWLDVMGPLGLAGVAPTTLTISSGVVSPTTGAHLIETEGSAATDTLDRIDQTNLSEGSILFIRPAVTSRTITLTHAGSGLGEIISAHGENIVLDTYRSWLLLMRIGTQWHELFRNVGTYNLRADGDNTRNIGALNRRWLQAWISTVSTGAVDTMNASETLAIGGTNASIINIGRVGATVNILGATEYTQVTQYQVADPLVTLNKGGAGSSAGGTGLEVEEASVITGYVKQASDRLSWEQKASANTGVRRHSTPINTGTITGSLALKLAPTAFTIDATEVVCHPGSLTIQSGQSSTVAGELTHFNTLLVDGTLTTTGITRTI